MDHLLILLLCDTVGTSVEHSVTYDNPRCDKYRHNKIRVIDWKIKGMGEETIVDQMRKQTTTSNRSSTCQKLTVMRDSTKSLVQPAPHT